MNLKSPTKPYIPSKPQHDKYDNIWEIRKSGYPTEEQIKEIVETPYTGTNIAGPTVRGIGRGLIYQHVEDFIRTVIRKRSIHLPIWKIVAPNLDTNGGAIYYIVCCDDYNFCFRATYGYWGTGPHEAALIEAIFERYKLFFEVRSADYLLNFFDEPLDESP